MGIFKMCKVQAAKHAAKAHTIQLQVHLHAAAAHQEHLPLTEG
jgi:hypothetical protein